MKKKLNKAYCLFFLSWLFIINTTSAQNISVSGVVKDAQAKTNLSGVSVLIKGTSTGTNTDANGKYTISAAATGTLVFSSIGYTTFEIAINNQKNIDVTLEGAAQSLNQVVVVGYGTQRKKDLTGSITSIKGTDLEKITSTNPIAALQGKVPGLTVVNSGTPGASPTVRIRGLSSTNNANPLYVVDGLLQDNIDFLNPNDIESIDLLRDASSTAIYGLRGANGVIAITTKRASRGKTVVNFQTNIGLQHVTNKISVSDAAGFKKLYNAQLANLGAASFDYTNYTANTHWQNLMLRDAVLNTDNLSVSSNGEKSTTLLNVGYNDQDGVVKYGNYKKYIVRLDEEIRVNSHIRIGGDFTGFNWRQDNSAASLNTAIYAAPIGPVQAPGDNIYYTVVTPSTGATGLMEIYLQRSNF
jgi:TonB-linked SusC/RagA family outer membrane protein